MAGGTRIALGAAGACVIGLAATVWLQGQSAERRLERAQAERRQLELEYGEALATHGSLTRELARERRRSSDLFEALGKVRAQLEEAVGRLAVETKQVWKLEGRLAAMQQQMDQLQGELAVTLEGQGSAARSADASGAGDGIQLERIIVSRGVPVEQQGRVLSVHGDWHFVVIDLGWDAVRIGDTVSIFRNEELLAKARIERVQEKVCAASLLPEWQAAEIQIDDQVRVL